MFGGKRREDPEPEDESPPPFTEAEVDAAVNRAFRIYDNESSAWRMWLPILRSLQAEQQRMKDRGLL